MALAEETQLHGLISGTRFADRAMLQLNGQRAASALHSAGIWQGDCVALLLRNDIAYFEATLGAGLLGASTVPMSWHLTAEEIAYILDDCDARAVVAHADLLSEAVLAVCAGREVIAVNTPAEVAIAYNLPEERCKTPGGLPEWSSWIGSFSPWQSDSGVTAQPMFYTSGTTGRPKGVKRKNVGPEIAKAAIQRTELAFGLTGDAIRSVVTGPLYHSAPNSYAMRVVGVGGLLVLQPRFDPEELLQQIQAYRITHLHMVPTMFVRLLALPQEVRAKYDLGSLVHVCHGSAPCPADIKRQMIEWWGEVIHEYYAMTETGIIAISTSSDWLRYPGSVGKPAPGVNVRIMDDQGKPCAAGVAGEIQVSSETTPFFTYYRSEEKTADARSGDFVVTGDIGYLNDQGFLFISDRKSDMVISGGVNVYPAEVEQAMVNLHGVRDCAVFGVPDAEFGERLIAVIESAEDLDVTVLRGALKARIAGYKIPRQYSFVRSLPREDSGKIKKRLLRDAWLAAHPG